MENMERFTLLYAIAYAITNSMENLRFDKEGYFHVLVFYTGYFIKEIENIPRVPRRYRNTRGSLGEQHFNFSFSQTSTRVSITVWKHGKCFLFLQYDTAVRCCCLTLRVFSVYMDKIYL